MKSSGWKNAAFVALAGICLTASVRDIVGRLADPSVPEHLSAWREAVRHVPDDVCGVPCADPADPDPVMRARLIALAWEAAPKRIVPLSEDDTRFATVITSSFLGADERTRLQAANYSPAYRNEFATVWTRESPAVERVAAARHVSVGEELCGLLAALCVMTGLWMIYRRWMGAWPKAGTLALAAAVFAILSVVTLQHGLLAPNGLGVQAGKAKLFWMCGGAPDGFWTDPAFAVCQPGYPPGLTLLALLSFAVSGGCGEHLVQLICPFAVALVFLEIASLIRNWRGTVIAFLFAISPLAVLLASGFYAEPFAALCLVCGIRSVRCGHIRGGWAIAGCAGLFRPEGLVLVVALGLAMRWSGSRTTVAWRDLPIAAAPSLAWQVFCLLSGAHVYGFHAAALPDFSRVLAAGAALGSCLLRFWLIGGVLLFSLAFWRRSKVAVVGVSAACGAGLLMAGFNVSEHFQWIVGNVIPRFVWMSLAAPLAWAFGGRRAK